MPLPARLLLAEDDPVSRSFLAQALAPGHVLQVAADGPSALQLALAERFDLLLLDVNLPGLRGPELLALLRADPGASSQCSPALALTADVDPSTRRTLRDAGFADVLGKPVSIPVLRETVRGLLRGVPMPSAVTRADDRARREAELPDWDEAAALRSANGDPAIVAALRQLLLAELAGQSRRIVAAVAAGDAGVARDELHRLRAASGFCGASRLAACVDRLAFALANASADIAGPSRTVALQQFEQAVQALAPDVTPERAAPAH